MVRAKVMKITIDLDSEQNNSVATIEDKSGANRSSARICLKTLHVLKSRNFSGSQLMNIESLLKPLQKAVEALPRKI